MATPTAKFVKRTRGGIERRFRLPPPDKQQVATPAATSQEKQQTFAAGATTPSRLPGERESLGAFTGGAPVRKTSLPTPERPVVEITQEDEAETVDRDDATIKRDIFIKRAKGQELTDEDLGFLFDQAEKEKAGVESPFEDILTSFEDRLTKAEEARGVREVEQKTEREKLIEEKKGEVKSRFDIQRGRVRESGERQKKAGQDVLSFAGAGRSTAAFDRAQEIQSDTEGRLSLLDQQASLENQLFERQLRGADAAELQTFTDRISDLRTQADKTAIDIAIKTAEFNAENALSGAESMENLLKAFGTDGARAIDKQASELLGFVADKFGNQIGEEKIPVNKKADEKSFGTFVDPFTGKTFFFNKNDPSEVIASPGSTTVAVTQPDGSTGSSESSDLSNMNSLGAGPEFTRDDGTTGNLGANCVKYGRTKVPNLPFGLWSKQDKQNAVNAAGDKDMSKVKVGDAILTSEGEFGHVATVLGIADNGDLILDEANYVSGEITQGRRINPEDDVIFGFISPTTGPQQSTSVSDNRREGDNAGIDSQVIATEAPKQNFPPSQRTEFDKFLKDGTIPRRFKFPAQQQQFMNQADVYAAQVGDQPVKLSPEDTFKFERDLRKDFEIAAKSPKKAMVQIGLMRISKDKLLKDFAKNGDLNAASQGILVTFQKLLDPESVVRESEYARSPAGQAVMDRLEGFGQKISQGGAGVTPEVLETFVELAELFMVGYENALIDSAAPIQAQANRFGLDNNSIFSPEIMKLIKRGRQETRDVPEDSQSEIESFRSQLEPGEKLIQRGNDIMAIREGEEQEGDIEL